MGCQWLRDSLLGQLLRLVLTSSCLNYQEEEFQWHESFTSTQAPAEKGDVYKVDWYSSHDEENPHNWSQLKKAFVLTVIGCYSFVVYLSAPIYTPSEDAFIEEFDVNSAEASLGLALYVSVSKISSS